MLLHQSMDHRQAAVLLALSVLLVSMYLWHAGSAPPRRGGQRITHGVPVPEIMRKHQIEEERKRIIHVTEGVYMARGFALANSIMVEGPDGVVIVDTTETVETGAEILTHFRNITTKPIKAIIFTHFHNDHTLGVQAFIEDPHNPPDVIAHQLLPKQRQEVAIIGKKAYHGHYHQFGIAMDPSDKAGSASMLKFRPGILKFDYVPNILVDGDYNEMEIGGLKIVLIHLPSESRDHLGVWLPDRGVIMPGDCVYASFPNLYAIRGISSRDVLIWADSVQKILDLKPLHVVPSHTQVLSGQDIEDTLTLYRDAILYVHDQTVRHLNKAMHPDAIAEIVKLPGVFRKNSHLDELYGRVDWSVKAVFNHYIGWFSGDPVELHPLTPKDRAERMVKLVGMSNLLQEARQAVQAKEYQWALELSSYVFKTKPDDVDARSIRLESLRMLASKETSSNGRHYYLSAALGDHKLIDWEVDISDIIKNAPLGSLISNLNLRFKAEDAIGLKTTAAFSFTDIGEVFLFHVENCVMRIKQVEQVPEDVDLSMTTTSAIFRKILLKEVSPLMAYLSGDIVIEGGLWKFWRFISYIEDDVDYEDI